jgi:hypothetical protein
MIDVPLRQLHENDSASFEVIAMTVFFPTRSGASSSTTRESSIVGITLRALNGRAAKTPSPSMPDIAITTPLVILAKLRHSDYRSTFRRCLPFNAEVI